MPYKDLKVLIVDDARVMRNIIRRLFHDLGIKQTDEAKDGKEALKKLYSGHYDFMTLDWGMPNLNGYESLKRVRMLRKLRALYVLMVTADAHRTQVEKALDAGADNYIVKPFTSELFTAKVEDLLQNGRREKSELLAAFDRERTNLTTKATPAHCVEDKAASAVQPVGGNAASTAEPVENNAASAAKPAVDNADSASATAKFCPDCGTRSKGVAKFCFNCGFSLNIDPAPS